MPDISLRFDKDMLVLSTPFTTVAQKLGIQTARDADMALLVEPEVFEDSYRLESIAGTQCIVAPTANLTPARLAHSRMDGNGPDLARQALKVANTFIPQHLLVEIGPCELPLDPSSKNSLQENRNQYERAARLFAESEFDAFFLNGFSNVNDLKCALTGISKVSTRPIFASVDVTPDGTLADGRGTLEEACSVIRELEGAVAGFASYADPDSIWKLTARAAQATPLPLLVQLGVHRRNPQQTAPTKENPYFNPDTMIPVAETLREAGAQFLRAIGDATPAYSSALVAATGGTDVVETTQKQKKAEAERMADLEAFIARERARVADALNGIFDDFEGVE